MPAPRRLALVLALLGLVGTLIAGPVAVAEPERSVDPASVERPRPGWVPPTGALLSDPMIHGRKRLILNRVIRAVRNTAKGEYIRTAVWNYDDRATTNALIDAHRRGVHVQIVVANTVRNGNWNRTVAALNANRRDRSFAVRCRGGCRGASIMHSKFVLFSRVHKARNISMVGSFNLTRPAGFRQWNDLVTTRDRDFYRSVLGIFRELAADRRVPRLFREIDLGRQKVTVWPSIGRNTIRDELERVRCRIPVGDRVDGRRRTKVRIAIAGWFDAYGTDIAKQVRRLWGRGCDVRIITTLAGRGINRTLRSKKGRGPVPIRRVTIDNNLDGIPERYLHMKAIAISGVFDGDTTANVLITGSPNWSARAQRSDEMVFRFLEVPKMTRQYIAHVDRLYRGPFSHRRAETAPILAKVAGGDPSLPRWFELD